VRLPSHDDPTCTVAGERFAYSGLGFMYLQHFADTTAGEALDSVVAPDVPPARRALRVVGGPTYWVEE
jgi:hypothetical protein